MKKLIGYSLLALAFAAPVYAMHHEGKEQCGKRFEKMDTDSDGKVSKAEFLAKIESHFSKADANADGFITKEEHQAMRDKWKDKGGKHGKAPMDAAK